MKRLSQSHDFLCTGTGAARRRRVVHPVLISVGALLGACALDTTPESSPSRAALEADSFDTPSELAAGAAAPPPATSSEAPPPSAAMVPRAPKAEPAAALAVALEEPDEPEQQAAAEVVVPPADTSACKPGDYEGVIAGTVNFGPLELSQLTGKISLRLVADEHNENLLRVERGRVEGVDLNKSEFVADLTGEVDCTSGQLMQSEVERGMYEDASELLKVGFSGTAKGRYSADPPALLGTWTISDDSTLLAGQGTWTTTLAESPN